MIRIEIEVEGGQTVSVGLGFMAPVMLFAPDDGAELTARQARDLAKALVIAADFYQGKPT